MMNIVTLAADNPVDHVVNHRFWVVDGWWLWSGNQTIIVLAGLICILLGLWLAKHVSTGPESEGHDAYVTRNLFAHMLEVIAVYLRDNVAEPLLHERTRKFMPFLWTLFFFILTCNLLGLVPFLDANHVLDATAKKNGTAFIGGTPTQSLWVTGVLAAISGVLIIVSGIRELGPKEFVLHMTGGLPLNKPAFLPIVALVFVIEAVGVFVIKPVALALRLFANMTAGHILVATMFFFTGLAFANLGFIAAGGITIASALAATAIYFLEIFVGFLQAFVFMFLTVVFISQFQHHGDHHDDQAHDADEHSMAVGDEAGAYGSLKTAPAH